MPLWMFIFRNYYSKCDCENDIWCSWTSFCVSRNFNKQKYIDVSFFITKLLGGMCPTSSILFLLQFAATDVSLVQSHILCPFCLVVIGIFLLLGVQITPVSFCYSQIRKPLIYTLTAKWCLINVCSCFHI